MKLVTLNLSIIAVNCWALTVWTGRFDKINKRPEKKNGVQIEKLDSE